MKGLKDLHRPQIDNVLIKCPSCGQEVERIKEVGDCWLDAGIVPYSTLNYMGDRDYWKKWFPAELISEMREQVRLWFYSLLFMSVTLEDKTPYEKVLLFEKVYDEKGQEMHKSGKNVIWFDEAVEKMGADVMRWMYVKTNLTQNVLFGYGPAKEITKNLDYLMNISSYLKLSLEKPGRSSEKMEMEDLWLVSRLESVKKGVKEQLEGLKPFAAARILEDFFINDFSRFYIKAVRNRIKKDSKVAPLIYQALLDTVKLMAPFTPFIAEHIYQDLFRKFEKAESVHLLEWPEPDEKKIDLRLERDFAVVQKITEAANAIRQEENVGLRYPVRKLVVGGPEEVRKSAQRLEDVLKRMANAKEVGFEEMEMDYRVKLSYSKVGPKYGKDVKKIEKALEKTDKKKMVNELKKCGCIELEGFELKSEDLFVEAESGKGREFRVEELCGAVTLDLEETEEITEECVVRELVRNVQQTRKDMGLVVKQKISIKLETDSETEKTIKKLEEEIKKEVGASDISFGKADGKVSAYKGIKIKFCVEVQK